MTAQSSRFDSFADWFLGLADESDNAEQTAKVRAFQLLLLLHLTVQFCVRALSFQAGRVTFAAVACGCFLVCLFVPRRTQLAALGMAALCWVIFFQTFPTVANHSAIELLLVSLVACFDVEDQEKRRLFLQTARWLVVIVLFYTGLQKVLHGAYFDGQFFGILVASRHPRFGPFLQLLMPIEEWQRLRRLGLSPDAGPYAVRAPLLLLVSNSTYVLEIAVPMLLLHRATRRMTVPVAIVFILAIQILAREFMFAALFASLLLLFPERAYNQRLVPGFAVFYLVHLGAGIGLLPEFLYK